MTRDFEPGEEIDVADFFDVARPGLRVVIDYESRQSGNMKQATARVRPRYNYPSWRVPLWIEENEKEWDFRKASDDPTHWVYGKNRLLVTFSVYSSGGKTTRTVGYAEKITVADPAFSERYRE